MWSRKSEVKSRRGQSHEVFSPGRSGENTSWRKHFVEKTLRGETAGVERKPAGVERKHFVEKQEMPGRNVRWSDTAGREQPRHRVLIRGEKAKEKAAISHGLDKQETSWRGRESVSSPLERHRRVLIPLTRAGERGGGSVTTCRNSKTTSGLFSTASPGVCVCGSARNPHIQRYRLVFGGKVPMDQPCLAIRTGSSTTTSPSGVPATVCAPWGGKHPPHDGGHHGESAKAMPCRSRVDHLFGTISSAKPCPMMPRDPVQSVRGAVCMHTGGSGGRQSCSCRRR